MTHSPLLSIRREDLSVAYEATGETRLAPLTGRSVDYVPGHTAHRTINTGTEALVYFGIYPSNAGHGDATIAKKNFSQLVVASPGGPRLVERSR
ncbi:hypothetical protein HQ447_15880 [bacterium]|nr:hypothetical protein [bacterium]